MRAWFKRAAREGTLMLVLAGVFSALYIVASLLIYGHVDLY